MIITNNSLKIGKDNLWVSLEFTTCEENEDKKHRLHTSYAQTVRRLMLDAIRLF